MFNTAFAYCYKYLNLNILSEYIQVLKLSIQDDITHRIILVINFHIKFDNTNSWNLKLCNISNAWNISVL
jgi:hypothetical protein